MPQIPFIFSQLTKLIDRDYFEYLVKRNDGNRYVKTLSCWNHFLMLVWAQLTDRKSLRDIECSLRGQTDKMYRLGMGKCVSRNALSHANARRPVSVYREMAQRMMDKASKIAVNDSRLSELARIFGITGIFAVDSSTVTFDLEKFPWSVPQKGKGGVKLHVMLDLLRSVPVVAVITGHEERDQTFMSDYPYRQGAIYIFDKAYVKTEAMRVIDDAKAFFILRKRDNMAFIKTERLRHRPHPQVYGDSIIQLTSPRSSINYPMPLRLVEYYSPEKNQMLCFLTNNFELRPEDIAGLYRCRWMIELFFRWIKQHLNITDFFGTSANAVHIQIYTAISTYCVLAIAAHEYKVGMSVYEFGRCLSTALTEKLWLSDWVKSINGQTSVNVDAQLRLAFDN